MVFCTMIVYDQVLAHAGARVVVIIAVIVVSVIDSVIVVGAASLASLAIVSPNPDTSELIA